MTAAPGVGRHAETAAPARPAGARTISYDVLRVLAIVGVVAIHTMGLRLGVEPREGLGWWVAAGMDVGSFWAVPVFVMISGALLLGPRPHTAGPGAFYRRRLSRLLPAIVFWHLVYLAGVRWGLREEPVDLARAGELLMDGAVFTGLYFLWLILGLYLVAPVLSAFLTGGGRARSVGTAAAAFVWAVVMAAGPGLTALAGVPRPQSFGIWNEWTLWIGYFVAGYALRDVRVRPPAAVALLVLAVLLFGGATWQLTQAPALPWLQVAIPVSYLGTAIVSGSLAVFVGATSLLDRWSPGPRARAVVERLSAATLGVFLVHLLLVELVREARPEWIGQGTADLLVLWASVVPLAFVVSLVALRIPGLRRVF